MNVDLVKLLDKEVENKKKAIEENNVLKEVKLLLDSDERRDLEILRKLSPQSVLSRLEEEKVAIQELEEKEAFLEGKVFTKDQIINLAKKYRLKFLLSRYYKGTIDPLVVSEIRNLERVIRRNRIPILAQRANMTVEQYLSSGKLSNFEFDNSDLTSKFYILAPASVFVTEKQKLFTKKPPKDPIMFYKEDDKHYRLLRKWGTDFTIYRRFLGIIASIGAPMLIFLMVFFPLILGTVIVSIIFGWEYLLCLILIGITMGFFYSNYDFSKNFSGEKYVESTQSFII